MAVGAHKLATREALVCRLTAIEEMAAMDVLCSDKTGTLTLNKLQINEPWVLEDASGSEDMIQRLILLGALGAKQSGDAKDAIDQVITDWCCENIGNGSSLLKGFVCHHFVPLSIKKYSGFGRFFFFNWFSSSSRV